MGNLSRILTTSQLLVAFTLIGRTALADPPSRSRGSPAQPPSAPEGAPAPTKSPPDDAPTPAPAPAEGTRARLLKQAEQALHDARFADARDAYLALWEATGDGDAGCNVGRLSFRIRDMVRAVPFLKRCAEFVSDPSEKADVRIELAQARRAVGEVHVLGAPGTQVAIDGQPRGQVPVVSYLEPGLHDVKGIPPGGATAGATVVAKAGEARVVDLAAAVAPPHPDRRVVTLGAVASGLTLGAGVALAIAAYAMERHGDAQLDKGQNRCISVELAHCGDAQNTYRLVPPLRNWSTVAFLGGAMMSAGTLSYVLVSRGHVSVSQVGSGVSVRAVW